jgi:hypothetical protein
MTDTTAPVGAKLDANGFVADSGQWTVQVAAGLARRLGIGELGVGHWRVIEHPWIASILRRTSDAAADSIDAAVCLRHWRGGAVPISTTASGGLFIHPAMLHQVMPSPVNRGSCS